MNIPNRLTVLRIILAPIFLAVLAVDFPFNYFVSAIIFIVASLTDMLDGQIARRQNLVTDFGKFLDPIADKMLTEAAFLGMMFFEECYGMLWVNFIILTREFLVTSVRLMAASKGGKVIAANIWGKLKTVTQMTAIIMTLIFKGMLEFEVISSIVWLKTSMVVLMNTAIWASVVLTVISGIIYLIQNKESVGFKK
ncbi:MAG: CDP-diacylglycerol--glycerol-3-phosphate 3-phosphatidyltransferase [Acutalibacteraceae bacterium]|nr:CDP-diacylglycerol--glycerol-3-phosphate 3-phosphatidyltransferase [Acutalibacteraceae bacterium]